MGDIYHTGWAPAFGSDFASFQQGRRHWASPDQPPSHLAVGGSLVWGGGRGSEAAELVRFTSFDRAFHLGFGPGVPIAHGHVAGAGQREMGTRSDGRAAHAGRAFGVPRMRSSPSPTLPWPHAGAEHSSEERKFDFRSGHGCRDGCRRSCVRRRRSHRHRHRHRHRRGSLRLPGAPARCRRGSGDRRVRRH